MTDKNIIDFSKYLDNKKTSDFSNTLIINACILALIDTTQEINRIVFYMNEAEIKNIGKAITQQMDAESLKDFLHLLKTQGANLSNIYECLAQSGTNGGQDAPIKGDFIKERANNHLNSKGTAMDTILINLLESLKTEE